MCEAGMNYFKQIEGLPYIPRKPISQEYADKCNTLNTKPLSDFKNPSCKWVCEAALPRMANSDMINY